jgi:hypothetical protein
VDVCVPLAGLAGDVHIRWLLARANRALPLAAPRQG